MIAVDLLAWAARIFQITYKDPPDNWPAMKKRFWHFLAWGRATGFKGVDMDVIRAWCLFSDVWASVAVVASFASIYGLFAGTLRKNEMARQAPESVVFRAGDM